MTKSIVLFVLALLVGVSALAQPVDTVWVQRYDGPASKGDYGVGIEVDASYDVYVAGTLDCDSSFDYCAIKYQADGDELWAAVYKAPFNTKDEVCDLGLGADHSVYITGMSSMGLEGDYLTVKYSGEGIEQWARAYGGSADTLDQAMGLAVDEDQAVYVTGWSVSDTDPSDFNYSTIKYGASGDTAWVHKYDDGVGGSDMAYDIVVDDDLQAYVTGMSLGGCGTIKYDSAGDTLWVRHYDGEDGFGGRADAVGIDRWGSVCVAGHVVVQIAEKDTRRSEGVMDLSHDLAAVKYDPYGEMVWASSYDGPGSGDDTANEIVIDNSGYVYVTGQSWGDGTDYDYVTIKFDPWFGDTLWVRRYNGPGDSTDIPHAIALDRKGNVLVTGQSWGATTGYDYCTIVYDPDGYQCYLVRYDGPASGDDIARDIAVDDVDNFYVTGESEGIGTSVDFATVKYRYESEFGGVSDDLADNESLVGPVVLTVTPNPCSQDVRIAYMLPAACHVRLDAYNVLGQRLCVLVDQWQNGGVKAFSWNPASADQEALPGGICFCRLTYGSTSVTEKLIITR